MGNQNAMKQNGTMPLNPVIIQQQVIEVNEVMPVTITVNDNMEEIADMTEQFSQTIDPILRMYNAGRTIA